MQLTRPLIGEYYVPGMGLVLGVVCIFLLGILVSQPGVGKLLSLVELPFTNLPVVKSIYSSLKDFADYFSPRRDTAAQQMVVVLKIPGQALEVVGLVTRQSVDTLPAGFLQGDRVAVYLPMGYMIGGYTVLCRVPGCSRSTCRWRRPCAPRCSPGWARQPTTRRRHIRHRLDCSQ